MTGTAAYNYSTFTTSEARGTTKAFQSLLRVGDTAPDFELPTSEGQRIRLSAYRDEKHVLLEFGAIT